MAKERGITYNTKRGYWQVQLTGEYAGVKKLHTPAIAGLPVNYPGSPDVIPVEAIAARDKLATVLKSGYQIDFYEEPDEFVVESLVQRFPVPNAREVDIAAAAVQLFEKGYTFAEVADMLRLSARRAETIIDSHRRRESRRAGLSS